MISFLHFHIMASRRYATTIEGSLYAGAGDLDFYIAETQQMARSVVSCHALTTMRNRLSNSGIWQLEERYTCTFSAIRLRRFSLISRSTHKPYVRQQ